VARPGPYQVDDWGEPIKWKAKWDDDFRAGFAAGKKAKKLVPASTAYGRGKISQRHGNEWKAGYDGATGVRRGAYATKTVRRAQELGLTVKTNPKKRGRKMARRKARKTTRRPVRRSTRKGQVRKTARRAYVSAPRRRRSNPKPITQTPAFRYAAWAAGGAAGEVILNQTGFLAKTIKTRVFRSAAYAALVIFVGRMALKGRNRENAIAVGMGMLIPGVSDYVGKMDLGGMWKLGDGNNNSNGQVSTSTTRGISAPTPNPYQAASSHAMASSGLTAIK